MKLTRRCTRIVSSALAGLSLAALGGGIATAAPASPQEPLTWMTDQHIKVGEHGPTVHLKRQVGDECTTISKTANSTTVECTDIGMALHGYTIGLHMNETVTADVTETKTGSINNELDYRIQLDPSNGYFIDGTIAPGAHKHFTAPSQDRGWFLGLDGKLGNSGTARITLTGTGGTVS